MKPSRQFGWLFIKGLVWDSTQSGRPFVELLEIASRGQLVDDANGHAKILASAAADGTAVTFVLPPRGRLRGKDIAGLARELHHQAVAWAAANPQAREGEIVAALLDANRPAKATVIVA